jgi:hypothetical protein
MAAGNSATINSVATEITLETLAAQLTDLRERVGDIAGDVSRLTKMADDAAPLLDSPVTRYLARMRKIKEQAGGTAP